MIVSSDKVKTKYESRDPSRFKQLINSKPPRLSLVTRINRKCSCDKMKWLVYLITVIIVIMLIYLASEGVFTEYDLGVYLILLIIPIFFIILMYYAQSRGNTSLSITMGLVALILPTLGCHAAYRNRVD